MIAWQVSLKRNGLTALALAASLIVAACGAGGGTTQQATNTKPIVIGGTLGLTGAFAGPSAEYKAVYDYWLNQINSHGGLLGRQVQMHIYNDESTPTTAQQLFNQLINSDHADLLLAPYTTFVGGAIVPITESHHMVLFNGGFVGIKLFKDANGWVVGSYTYQEPDYTKGVLELIKGLPAGQKPTSVAIFTAQNPFTIVDRDGYNGQGGAVNYAKDAGLRVVVNEEYPSSTTDFTSLVQKAKAAGADLLLELGLPNDSLQVARTVNQLGYKPKMFCLCGSQVTTLSAWPKLGAPAEGVIGTTISWPSEKFTGLSDLQILFQQRGEQDIPAYGVVSYAILQVLQQAVEGAKTLDQAKLRSFILSGHVFHTAAGDIKYQQDGTPVFSQILLQFTSGKNNVIWPSNYATAKPTVPLP